MQKSANRFAAHRTALFGSVAPVGLALIGLALPAAALAQDAAAQDAQEAASAYGNEIVVTATKREQTLQDVPVAVSVTTAETIERAQIRDIRDLSSVVPSLRVSQLQSSANTNFFIRGFGNGANNVGIEPSVGLFIDGVYRSRSAAMIGDMPDVKRVEVLRGPQSTLFGKNASAGVISFVTREPQFTTGGNIEATYGNFNAITVKGVVTGPLTEKIAISLAGGINERDGYVRDLGPAGGRTNERDRWFVRNQVLIEPSKDLKIRIIGDYSKINENCCAVVNLVSAAPTSVIKSLGGKVNLPADRFGNVVYNNLPSSNKIKAYGLSNQVDWSINDLTLTSITAWRKTINANNQDSDFTSADLLSRNLGESNVSTFTQELRLASDFDGPLNFLVGGFYFDEKIRQHNELYLGKDFRAYANGLIAGQSGCFSTPPSSSCTTLATVEALMGEARGNPALYAGKFFAPGTGNTENYRLRDKNFSLFGQVDYEITDRLTLTGGVNYTSDKKRYSTNVTTNELFSSLVLADFIAPVTSVLVSQGVGTLLNTAAPGSVPSGFASGAQIAAVAGGLLGPTAQGAYNTIIVPRATAGAQSLTGLAGLQFLPPFVNLPNAVENGKLSDSDPSFTLRLAYDVSDAVNAYVSYATGYKAASVNLSRDSKPFAADRSAIIAAGLAVPNLVYTTRYAPAEDATVYEAGVKAKWGTTSVNVAVFKQSIQGFQSNLFTGTGFVLTSAGKQSTWGVEFEGMAKPIDQLTLNLAATYLKPKYDSFLVSAFGDLSGTRPAGIPTWSTTVGFTWEQPVGNGDTLFLSADYHYESPYQSAEGLPNFLTRLPNGAIDPASIPVALAAARQFRRDVHELNASATWAMQNGLELGVWGRNLTNHRYIGQFFDSPAQQGSVSGYPNQPRTYGVSARYRF